MNLQSELKKAFLPVAAKYGLENYAKNNYGMCYKSSEVKRTRRVDVDWYPKSTLKLYYFDSNLGHYALCDFMKLDETQCIRYNDDIELRSAIDLLVDVFDKQIMPYMGFIEPLLIHCTHDIYQVLSENTIDRAEAFMRNNGLSAEHKPENYRYVENLLVRIRGEDHLQQKIGFTEHLETILGAVSYLGEIKRRRYEPAQWEWYEGPEYTDDDGVKKTDFEFCVVMSENRVTFDPLDQVIGLWNHFPKISKHSLEGFRMDCERPEM